MRSSRLVVYRSDESGRLKRVRDFVRYRCDKSRPRRTWSPTAVSAGRVETLPSWNDRPQYIEARALRIRERIRRLQNYPEYWCDPEIQAWIRLYRRVEHVLGQLVC